jgi:hypothetical protein
MTEMLTLFKENILKTCSEINPGSGEKLAHAAKQSITNTLSLDHGNGSHSNNHHNQHDNSIAHANVNRRPS